MTLENHTSVEGEIEKRREQPRKHSRCDNAELEQMVEQWGVTEELKMQDQVEWVRRMNNIKNIAEESVMKIIYS